MSENNICFEINNLEFGYNNRKKILKNINAEINSRALISLIGPNGSGKSTLLRTLSGIQAYTGSVKINNFEVKNLSRKNIGALIGVVPQNFRPAYPFSVWEVIAMGRLPHKNLFDRMKSDDENLIINAAKRLEIEHLLTRNIMSLSGGEAQRVLIACVLAQDPPVLLLDEPT
ncbi:MAG: ABC transporter ATP-binding protein, partial [Synergistaceae bacterium]|nr:ABC transporter ATP-binding protein [Synergistaceae bacterium]